MLNFYLPFYSLSYFVHTVWWSFLFDFQTGSEICRKSTVRFLKLCLLFLFGDAVWEVGIKSLVGLRVGKIHRHGFRVGLLRIKLGAAKGRRGDTYLHYCKIHQLIHSQKVFSPKAHSNDGTTGPKSYFFSFLNVCFSWCSGLTVRSY